MTKQTETLKRGTRVNYRYAAGKVVPGKIVCPYAPHMPDWFLVELTDEHGKFSGGCHRDQIMVTDNRAA